MNGDVIYETENSTDVYNSILIDEYYKCIFDNMATQENDKSAKDNNVVTSSSQGNDKSNMENNPVSSGVTSQEKDNSIMKNGPVTFDSFPKIRKLEKGMNVRTPPWEDDGESYEAVILKIYDEKYAVIKFIGYDNEEILKITDLCESKGEKAIKEQMKNAELGYENSESEKEIINWKAGMPCRAYYSPKDVIYEGTVESVDTKSQTANVVLLGYNVKYNVSFEHMYQSDPSLREKQENTAKKRYMNDSVPTTANVSSVMNRQNTSGMPQTMMNKAVNGCQYLNFQQPNVPVPRNRQYTNGPQSSNPNRNLDTHSESHTLIQPKNEREAIACLVSANYLCGYYAGYLDCVKNSENQNQKQN